MPIKIHHGPPGSFKTSGALADDFLREAKEGRLVVTNVRGLTRDRVIKRFPDLPASFDVINVDDKTLEGREKWAKWFHWVPAGAYIFLDEAQDIWPRNWRDADLKSLDYPGGVEKAALDDRPKDWAQALDKHRHWNWDLVLTTPQYSKVRDDVKGVADMAYKHKDLALLGWSGRYIEGAHAADDTGKNKSDFVNVVHKKVPSYVFDLYDSTATGAFSVTKNGFSLFKNPRILGLLFVILAAGAFVISNGPPRLHAGSTLVSGGSAALVHSEGSAVASAGASSGGASSSGVGGSVSRFTFSDPLAVDDVFIIASARFGAVWKYVVRVGTSELTNNNLLDLGYTVESKGACGVLLKKDRFERVVLCSSVLASSSGDRPPDKPLTTSEPPGLPLAKI